MKFRKVQPLLLLLALGGLLSITACDTPSRHKLLTIFFDGVPPLNSATNAALVTIPNSETNQVVAAPSKPAPPPEDTFTVHPPFQQQQCLECHQASSGMGLQSQPPQLCWNCHKDFLTGKKVEHDPVENGGCANCHDPHQSPNKNLLLQPGNALCLTCHDDPLAEGKFKHEAVELGNCVDCHNPHASNNKALLKETVPALCWDCHDNFLEKAKFQHDVVEDCTACHAPHASSENSLLKKNVLKLCADCHDDKDLKADKGHAGFEGKSCTDCHDPHVGTDPNLLKPSAKPK